MKLLYSENARGTRNRKKIENAIDRLGGCASTMQIKKFLDEDAHNKVKLQYNNSKDSKEINLEIKRMSLSRETISHWLTKEVSKGLLKKEGNQYCRIGLLYSEVETISRVFGDNLIFKFFDTLKDKDTEGRFLKMLEAISVIVAYSFLRFLQPKCSNLHSSDKKSLFPLFDQRQRRIFRHIWLENAIPVSSLLFLFEGIIGLVDYKGRVINKKPFLYDFRYDEYSDNELTTEEYDYYLNLLREKFSVLMDMLDSFDEDCTKKLENIYVQKQNDLLWS